MRTCQNVRITQRVVIVAAYVGCQNCVNEAVYIGCENVSENVRMSELRRVVMVAVYVGYQICPWILSYIYGCIHRVLECEYSAQLWLRM